MGDRIDELKGNVKEGAGKLTGDRDLQAEGRAEHDTARADRKIKGAGKEVKGAVKQGLGDLTGDERLRSEGELDRAKGDAERAG